MPLKLPEEPTISKTVQLMDITDKLWKSRSTTTRLAKRWRSFRMLWRRSLRPMGVQKGANWTMLWRNIKMGPLAVQKRTFCIFIETTKAYVFVDFCCAMKRTSRELQFDKRSSILLKASKNYRCAKVIRFFAAIGLLFFRILSLSYKLGRSFSHLVFIVFMHHRRGSLRFFDV